MKLLLLDKDGTIVNPKSGNKFVQTPWDQEPLPGVKKALEHYHQRNWKMVIISNQGGVAANHKTLENTILEMKFCLELFPEIEEAYFCPDFEGMECYKVWRDDFIHYKADDYTVWEIEAKGQFRKPKPGMLKLAQHIHVPDECWMVGDRPEDEQTADSAGINFMAADIWRERFTSGQYKIPQN